MNALIPQLKFGVLCFVNVRPGLAVLKVVELVAVGKRVTFVGLFDLFDFQSLVPRKEQRFLGGTIILNMALSANKAPHFLPGRVNVRIVVALAVSLPPAFDAC